MTAMPLAAPPPLLDMLGARWKPGARAAALAWDGAGGMTAFGLSDGSLAVARLGWDGGPTVRAREGGGAELVPPSAPPPAIARIPVHDGPCLALAADPDGGFLSGGADGQVARVQADGAIDTIARVAPLAAAPLAAGRGGWRLCAAGRRLIRLGGDARAIELPGAVMAVAVAPDGSCVAAVHEGGLTLWAGGDAPRRLAADGIHSAVAWSGDSRRVASTTRDGDVFLWDIAEGTAGRIDEGRFMPRSLGFTADGMYLVTGGTGAVACWNLASLQPERCGIGSRDAVLEIACHPRRTLIAAGYANGAVLICRPATRDVLFVRGAGGGAVSALAWSPDGGALAFGVDDGEIGLAALPDLLFRDATS